MGPEIIIPVVVLAILVPLGFWWARTNLKGAVLGGVGDDTIAAPAQRLTSAALRDLPTPPWRVVYEIADDKLGGVGHVVIGPPGIFALRTSMEPLPTPITGDPDAHAVAQAAIARSDLDDALRRCSMSSDRLVRVHWGAAGDDVPDAFEMFAGLTVVDGRSLRRWADSLTPTLSDSQVDLAWQTVTTAIGRPDPLG
jgi:hypothetical protein